MSENLPAKSNAVTNDPWSTLRSATSARIALGRAGGSLPTHEWLDFKSAHAAARDAVHVEFDAEHLAGQISELGVQTIVVGSAAGDRAEFLQRPDRGRRLAPASQQLLEGFVAPPERFDLAIVVSDGLSALAVQTQAAPLLASLLPLLRADRWRVAPTVVARFGRVALEDQVGALLGAQLALMLLGERPGLGSPDSLGAYLVYDPKLGNTDAQRNCVSNIRPEGLPIPAAAETIRYLLNESRQRQLSGVQLKDQRVLQ
ncbi:ethanolamine ammonia-lyase subunit EutC [Lacipirellula parvula]|uniref:Ethanolamine ammonia-lyase small subunit n=1 Tax=Lacipirellula parvula TaxID=2650471 RepID=A0A5K7XBZ9_9BACT|nr:ethanolamine ammonia-lyase subunit EutC [Lacipirellula parvula]BBO33885.1 ethanolamine ammonia-lyase light chain [Lacipirellula parvula]